MNASEYCYYADPFVCDGESWECLTCHEHYCQAHYHQTDKGVNVECVACERNRMDQRDEPSLFAQKAGVSA